MRLIVNRRLAGVPGFLLLALLACPAAAQAQAALDPSFGSGGLARIANPIGEGTFWAEDANDVALQPDGKILVAADGRGQDTFYWAVVRYLPDGRLDPGFGVGGVAVLTQTDPGEARGIALQPDGRIVVTGAGWCREKCFAAARLTPDGQFDPSFGEGGIVRHDPIRRTGSYDVAVQPDGRIVLVGDWYKPQDANDDSVACVMRLLPDGRLDRSFSRNGVVRVDHGYGDDLLIGVEMQGRRIVAFGEGRVTGGGGSGFAAIRLRRNGSLDRTFGRRGRRLVSFGRRRWARPVSFDLAPGGKIVVGGNSGIDIFRWRPAVARLTRNGALDRSFSGDGRVLTRIRPFGGEAGAVMGDARGGVLVAGKAYTDAARDPSVWAVARYTSGGRLDRSFAPGGIFRGAFAGLSPDVSSLAPWGSGLLAAGDSGGALGLARFTY
jgi:uncharacterized delta-60 repeat protein